MGANGSGWEGDAFPPGDLTNNTLTGNIADPCVGTTLTDVAYVGTGTSAAMPDLNSACNSMGLTTFTANVGTPGFGYVGFATSNKSSSGTTGTATTALLL